MKYYELISKTGSIDAPTLKQLFKEATKIFVEKNKENPQILALFCINDENDEYFFDKEFVSKFEKILVKRIEREIENDNQDFIHNPSVYDLNSDFRY